MTGIESTLLLKWVNYFNIETEWTQENKSGHRRYTHHNVEQIVKLKELIQNKKMTWEQANVFFQGVEPQFINDETKTAMEKKLDVLLEQRFNEEQRQQIQQSVVEILSQVMPRYINEATRQIANASIEQDNEQRRVKERLERNDEILTEKKLKREFRREAIEQWESKPEEEQFTFTKGLFKVTKEPNLLKREDFITDYVEGKMIEHYESIQTDIKERYGS